MEVLQFRLINLKKFVLCLLSFASICCDESNINIDFLKKNGYKEITCQTVESYQTEESSFIEINRGSITVRTLYLQGAFTKIAVY